LTLDGYMTLLWKNFGKPEIPYTIDDLRQTLSTYAGKEFADDFFNTYIIKSGIPDYDKLFKHVGIVLETKNNIEFGANVRNHKLMSNPKIGGSAYKAGFQKNDKLLKIGTTVLDEKSDLNAILNTFKVGDEVNVLIERYGSQKEMKMVIATDVSYGLQLLDDNSKAMNKKLKQQRDGWLKSKVN